MSEFQISDYMLSTECKVLAQDIFADIMADARDETPEDMRDAMTERAHETADGHQWVIYHYKALMLCAHCDTSHGEEFLEDTGMPETPTFYGLATIIAYGEMLARIEESLSELIEESAIAA